MSAQRALTMTEAKVVGPGSSLAEPPVLTRYRPLIAGFMRANTLSSRWQTGRMTSYHMGWADRHGSPVAFGAGKLVRPSLCLWACEACGADPSRALAAAAALEWLHNFTLIHDDIQDGDRERRYRETVWSVWGAAQGINAGDALFALAFKTLAGDRTHPERALRAAEAIAAATLEVVEGQCLDLNLEGRADAAVRTYLRMVRAKTGALIGASLEVGALMATAPPSTVARFRLAGRRLGTAFQIRDDWLGVWGDPAHTGKSTNGDVSRRKLTYPIVAGYAALSPIQRNRLRELFGSKEMIAESEIRSLLGQAGGAELTRGAPGRFAEKAIAAVARCGIRSQYVEVFAEVARYVADRTR